MKILSHNLTGNSLVLVYQAAAGVKTLIMDKSHIAWPDVLAAYKRGEYDSLPRLMDARQYILMASKGKLVVVGEAVYYNGEEMTGLLFERILFYVKEGLPYDGLIKFAENLFQNPSETSRKELYKFLEHKNMPVTQDGCFLAYKGVRQDFYSKRGDGITVLVGKVDNLGRIYNGVGEKIVVKREEVCDNSNVDCGRGIHVGSYEYAKMYADGEGGGKMVVVKVNPRDAVSVPHDCNHQKLRCCAYEVIGEETRALNEKEIAYDMGGAVEEATSTLTPYGKGAQDGANDAKNGRSFGPYETGEDYERGYFDGYFAIDTERVEKRKSVYFQFKTKRQNEVSCGIPYNSTGLEGDSFRGYAAGKPGFLICEAWGIEDVIYDCLAPYYPLHFEDDYIRGYRKAFAKRGMKEATKETSSAIVTAAQVGGKPKRDKYGRFVKGQASAPPKAPNAMAKAASSPSNKKIIYQTKQ